MLLFFLTISSDSTFEQRYDELFRLMDMENRAVGAGRNHIAHRGNFNQVHILSSDHPRIQKVLSCRSILDPFSKMSARQWLTQVAEASNA